VSEKLKKRIEDLEKLIIKLNTCVDLYFDEYLDTDCEASELAIEIDKQYQGMIEDIKTKHKGTAVKFCVCTEAADGYGTSMSIVEKFDKYEDAESFILNSSDLKAKSYYIQKLYMKGEGRK
jgi:peroxiredoxin family protein